MKLTKIYTKTYIVIPLVLILLALSFSDTLAYLKREVWWFEAVGFTQVFWTRLTWQVLIWIVTFAVYFAVLWSNYRWAMKGKPASNCSLTIS